MTHKTVKLTLTSSDPKTLVSRYAAIATPMRPNRPHIPSHYINVKERALGPLRLQALVFLELFPFRRFRFRVPVVSGGGI